MIRTNSHRVTQRNIIAILLLAAVIVLGAAVTAPSQAATKTSTTGWKTSGSAKSYFYQKGKCYKDCFATISGSKYFFNEKGELVKGHFEYKDKYYYSSTETGKVKTSAGFVTYQGNKYYVQKGGEILAGWPFQVDGKKYYAYYNGRLGTGIFKYCKYYHYADSNGVTRTTAGFVTSGSNRYYVAAGGRITRNSTFKVSGYTYKSLSKGQLAKGVFKQGSAYYYANPDNNRVKTTKGWITYNGKKYYAASGGKIYTGTFITVDGDKYYATETGAIQTGTFKVSGVTYKATSAGRITTNAGSKVQGIDVSYFQHSIDWKKVKASGVKFVIVRCGYRGSTSGKLYTDSTFMTNIKGAKAAGLEVGVYFFTEAINAKEGRAEADYCIKLIKQSGVKVTYPVVIDTENLSGARASSAKLSKTKRTEAVKGFCERVEELGYTPMIYASTSWLNNQLNMSQLSDYHVWVAQYYSRVTYGGTYKCWQYTSSGKVNGISTRVDMNYWYK